MQSLQRIIWLASFPKSGNTWMRALLGNYLIGGTKALGINELNRFTTGDIRQDFFDHVAGKPFVAEDFDDWLKHRTKVLRVIAASKPNYHFVKSHSKMKRVENYDLIPPEVTAAAIYILRNPFDVVPSYSRHLSIGIDETIERMQNTIATTATDTKIFEVLGRWDDHVNSWLGAPGLPLCVVRYEDLLEDTEKELRKILNFLKIPAKDGQMRRAIRHASFKSLQKQEQSKGFKERPEGMAQFFAKGTSGGWREALTPAQIARVREAFLPVIEKHYPELLEETAAIAETA
jgi:hypothetical protein